MALVLALGMLVVLTTVGTSVAYYATAHSGSLARSGADQKAFWLAEAALNDARAELFAAPDPTNPGAVPQQSVTLEGGTASWYGSLSGSTWTLVGTGTVRNPSGPSVAPVVRKVSGRVVLTSSQQGTPNNAVWNYLYSDDPTGTVEISNSVTIDTPLYVRGNLSLENSARVIGPRLQVGGRLNLENSATVGGVGTPIAEADVAGGCTLDGGQLHRPCSSADRVHASIISTTTSGLVKPPVDLPGWYRNADLGPLRSCASGSFPGGFDNDGVLNHSLPRVDLTPPSPYDCRVTDGSGRAVGQLAWTPGQGGNPGTLVVAGTIFFDGDIAFRNNANAVYQGRATIYTSGTVSFLNSAKLCGVAACDGTWNANQNLLALVAGSPSDDVGCRLANNTAFQGAVYVVDDYEESNSAVVWGPVIARRLRLSNSVQHHSAPFATLLPGMPATYQQAILPRNEDGSYSG